MHELSIALSIIDIVEKEAKKEKSKVVTNITLEIGSMAGIEMDSFNFSLKMAKNGTVMENAKIDINIIQAKAKCLNCGEVFSTKSHFEECPSCCDYKNEIIEGKDLKIKSLVVDI